jgi:hypothetical protein
LGLHSAPESFVDSFDHVRRADGLPLLLRKRVEGQEFVARLVEVLDGAGYPLLRFFAKASRAVVAASMR